MLRFFAFLFFGSFFAVFHILHSNLLIVLQVELSSLSFGQFFFKLQESLEIIHFGGDGLLIVSAFEYHSESPVVVLREFPHTNVLNEFSWSKSLIKVEIHKFLIFGFMPN